MRNEPAKNEQHETEIAKPKDSKMKEEREERTEIAKHEQHETEIEKYDRDAVDAACAAYADKTQGSAIAGDLLAFRSKFTPPWGRGQGKDAIPSDATFVCNVPETWCGFIRYEKEKVVEHRLVRIDKRPPDRNELGHFDESKWELDNDNNARDPWSPTDRMVMRESGDGELALLTFSTGSYGGRNALGALSKAYAQRSDKFRNMYPVVKLGTGSWDHKTYGPILKPIFEIVGWEPWEPHQGELPLGDDVPPNVGPPPRWPPIPYLSHKY